MLHKRDVDCKFSAAVATYLSCTLCVFTTQCVNEPAVCIYSSVNYPIIFVAIYTSTFKDLVDT